MPAVVVTGAAKGIGEACALRLAGRGHQVFAGVRRAQDGEALMARAQNIVPLLLDVTSQDQIAAAAAQIEKQLKGGGLAGLVNNAGIAIGGPLEFLPLAELRRQFEVNVIGQLAVTQALLPLLRKTAGRVVNIGSISGRSALPMTGAYCGFQTRPRSTDRCAACRAHALAHARRCGRAGRGGHTHLADLHRRGRADARRMPRARWSTTARVLNALKENLSSNTQGGLPPDRVARVVEQALFDSRPRTRYVVGRDARVRLLLERLPDRWRDRLIERRLRRMQRRPGS